MFYYYIVSIPALELDGPFDSGEYQWTRTYFFFYSGFVVWWGKSDGREVLGGGAGYWAMRTWWRGYRGSGCGWWWLGEDWRPSDWM